MSETVTATRATPAMTLKLGSQSNARLDELSAKHLKLSREQCGHLRHFHNIASKLDGDWSFLGAQEGGQEWDTAYRYQLATMTYAVGAAHYHRLPLMRSMFKTMYLNLIRKMMNKEVWSYWYLTSQSGIRVDPDLKELRKPWADPVCKENIMYSGHLLLMVSLFTMLFADHRFDEPDGIVFNWSPLFWGMGPEKFVYTRRSLQDVIVKQMEDEGWMGVCCEPNMIFIICNQFPLIAMRYNDVVDHTATLDYVLPKYKAAWEEKQGFVGPNGLFRRWFWRGRKQVLDSEDIHHTAWAMAFMPWNSEMVASLYPSIGNGFISHVGDKLNINPPVVANKIREMVNTSGADPNSNETLQEARNATAGQPLVNPRSKPFMSPTFGYIAQWLSEVAGGNDLAALLRHADQYLHPAWDNGGLYYPRSDSGWDSDGNWTNVDPYTGNSAIGYARLNIKGGQKKMFDSPWTKEQIEAAPWVGGFGFGDDIDCLRGVYDTEEQAVLMTLRTWNDSTKHVEAEVHKLPTGHYDIYVDGVKRGEKDIDTATTSMIIGLDVTGDELDLVVLRTK